MRTMQTLQSMRDAAASCMQIECSLVFCFEQLVTARGTPRLLALGQHRLPAPNRWDHQSTDSMVWLHRSRQQAQAATRLPQMQALPAGLHSLHSLQRVEAPRLECTQAGLSRAEKIEFEDLHRIFGVMSSR